MPIDVSHLRFDDAEDGPYFARELEHVLARTFQAPFPQLTADRMIPVNTEANAGAEAISYKVFQSTGIAKIFANMADDIPLMGIHGQEMISPVRSSVAGFETTRQDIRAGVMTGRPLDPQLAISARKAMERLRNKIAYFGDAVSGLPGLLTNPNITTVTAPLNAGGTSRKWVDKTADEILTDLNYPVLNIGELTNNNESPDTIALPSSLHGLISTKRVSDSSDTTVLEFFLRTQKQIRAVEIIPELAKSSNGATLNADVMLTYEKQPDKLEQHYPMATDALPPQAKGLGFENILEARIAGTIIYFPLSVMITDGIGD